MMTNRNCIAVLTVFATVFLLFLGMRVPDLNQLTQPKPRPRAVIKQQLKSVTTAAPSTKSHVDPFVATLTNSVTSGPPHLAVAGSADLPVNTPSSVPPKGLHSGRAPPPADVSRS